MNTILIDFDSGFVKSRSVTGGLFVRKGPRSLEWMEVLSNDLINDSLSIH